MGVDLSYCVVNTNGREDLLGCVDAILRTHPEGVESELLVLDNASDDGSAAAVRERFGDQVRLIERSTRAGKAANDTALLREAQGGFCLLLNEDAELRPGATAALLEALRADPGAAAAGAQLLSTDGEPRQCAWRLPGVGSAIAGALFLHRILTVESGGDRTRAVGWVQSAAMLVRREAAEEVDYLDPEFFVYGDETDLCKRLGDAGWRILHVPAAEAFHHDQLITDRSGGAHRVVEFHRNRDRYMRKHHGAASAWLVRWLSAWPYVVRAAAALVLPGHDPRWYWLHARQSVHPSGDGVREAAEAYNRQLSR